MSLSWRHHYILKFYLKGFADSTGHFFVYDRSKQIIDDQSKSPRSYFFERDRNTFELPQGELDDFIETSLYQTFDNVSKYAFEKLRTVGAIAINDDIKCLSSIIQFISGIFYRIPKYDDYHNNEILKGNVKYLLPIYKKPNIDVRISYFEENKNRPLYRYACRFHLSLHGTIPVGDELKKWYVYQFKPENNRHKFLTGDCPIILNDITLFNTGQEIILIPLSEKHLAVRTNVELHHDLNLVELMYFVNLYILKNSDRYICCSEKELLGFYVERIQTFKIADIKNKILSMVI
jgi:hypothetical protein